MLTKELFSICTFYAISPVHAGSGAATSTVDLPIQRERHTNWPHIQASAVKGAMRAHYRKFADGNTNAEDAINLVFGSDKDNDGGKKGFDQDYPGAISISDAKLLAFPMRSNIAPFVWVTCPAVLKRLNNDLDLVKLDTIGGVHDIDNEEAVIITGDLPDKVILEDAIVKTSNGNNVPAIPEGFPIFDRLLLISDEMFDYCVSCCTEVQTQIKINSETGTAEGGALRYQELLPADTALYSVVYYSKSSGLNGLQANTIKQHIEDVIKDFIQIGGDETLGRGICKISWINGGER